MKEISTIDNELHYNLKKPCKDCPFRKNPGYRKPKHIENMALFLEPLMNLEAAHTCHVTDARSDHEPAKNYVGPLEHCIGMILMCEKNPRLFRQRTYFLAAVHKKFDLTKLTG